MKACLSLLLLSLLYGSCTKEETVPPPTIRALTGQNTDCTCDPYIHLYLWRQQKVYVWAAGGPACDWTPVYYRENGEAFPMNPGYGLADFLKEGRFLKKVWACKNE